MTRPRNRNVGTFIRTTVRLPSTLAARLRELAERNMRSYSAEVSVAMARYVESGDPAPEPPHWEPGTLESMNMTLSTDTYKNLKQIAFENGRSVNQEIVLSVERHIEKESGGIT